MTVSDSSTLPVGPVGHDTAGALLAVESDLEYFRTKRFEPRVFQLIRRGALSLLDLIEFQGAGPTRTVDSRPATTDERVRILQDRLDAYVVGIYAMSLPGRTVSLALEDVRHERGDYDPLLRFTKRAHDGSLDERIARLEVEMAEAELTLDAVTATLISRGELDAVSVQARRQEVSAFGHRNGARIVARAWSDPTFKARLIETGRDALRDLDVPTGRLGRLAVAEDTDEVHNVVVCTLCSCYPHDVLGDPPWWYRRDEYKHRIIADPRSALADMFGLTIADTRKIRVRDSTSDLRWMVLPQRPAGTEDWDEERLAAIVTPESLVGTAELAVSR